jgi:hypothetical protein
MLKLSGETSWQLLGGFKFVCYKQMLGLDQIFATRLRMYKAYCSLVQLLMPYPIRNLLSDSTFSDDTANFIRTGWILNSRFGFVGNRLILSGV